MRNNKLRITIFAVIGIMLVIIIGQRIRGRASSGEIIKEVKPVRGAIQTFISTTGTVMPKNRLEIKPPVNGRIDEVLVKEGEHVKEAQKLAWMSSTERAALLDAARGKGEESLKYWQDIYKPIPLISPIDGEVIVAKTQPGQTVTAADPVLVLSDHLIVRAQVDETDIGKVRESQSAAITLDAYPDKKIKGKVEHIYYESKTVNNVTVYEVDILPEEVPEFFRSGMNASIDLKEKSKDDALIVPQEALLKEKGEAWLLVKTVKEKKASRRSVTTGIADDKNVEIVSGLDDTDTVIIKSKKYSLPKDKQGKNPFAPQRRR